MTKRGIEGEDPAAAGIERFFSLKGPREDNNVRVSFIITSGGVNPSEPTTLTTKVERRADEPLWRQRRQRVARRPEEASRERNPAAAGIDSLFTEPLSPIP